MTTTEKEIMNIKKTGHLVALNDSFQYWVKDNILLSVNVEGTSFSIWCGLDKLRAHLNHLEAITGHRKFVNDPYTVVVDPDFVKRYCI